MTQAVFDKVYTYRSAYLYIYELREASNDQVTCSLLGNCNVQNKTRPSRRVYINPRSATHQVTNVDSLNPKLASTQHVLDLSLRTVNHRHSV